MLDIIKRILGSQLVRSPYVPIIVMVCILLTDSFFIVGKSEQATIRRLGRYTGAIADSGFHLKLPFVDKVAATDVRSVRRVEIGFETVKVGPPAQYRDIEEESLTLTGDENLIMIDFVAQYQVVDPAAWQFNAHAPERLIHELSEIAMRRVIGLCTFDFALTTGKGEIQTQTRELLQASADELGLGVRFLSVQMQDVDVPKPVVQAFTDVVRAKEEKNAKINDARAYANHVVPKARGQAAAILNEAKGQAALRTKQADGDARAFLALAKEYSRAPETTSTRLKNEALADFLNGKNVVIGGAPAQLLPLASFSSPH